MTDDPDKIAAEIDGDVYKAVGIIRQLRHQISEMREWATKFQILADDTQDQLRLAKRQIADLENEIDSIKQEIIKYEQES